MGGSPAKVGCHACHARWVGACQYPGPACCLPCCVSPQVAALVRECMEGAASLAVPLRVKLHSGPSWGQLEELRL